MADELPQETDPPLPRDLRFLKRLVTVLTGTMILGVITIVFLLVMRLGAERRPILTHPELFDIPAGVSTLSYSLVNGYTVIIGDDGVIRVFATDTRELIETHALPN